MVLLNALQSNVAMHVIRRLRLAFPSTRIQPSFSFPATCLGMMFCKRDIAPDHVRHRSNRSRRGLYDGKDIGTGNNVSFSMRATKRKFKPNVFHKSVYSETLDAMIKFHLTASTLRSIDKAGGLDNYLLKNDNITEGEGYTIKKAILKRQKNQAKMERKKNKAESENT